MANNGKTIKLTGETLQAIEIYRESIVNGVENPNIKRYIQEMSYDKIIYTALYMLLMYDEIIEDEGNPPFKHIEK